MIIMELKRCVHSSYLLTFLPSYLLTFFFLTIISPCHADNFLPVDAFQKAKAVGPLDQTVDEPTFAKALNNTPDLAGKVHPFTRLVAGCLRSGDQKLITFANNMVDSYGKSSLLTDVFGWHWGASSGNTMEQRIYDTQKRVASVLKHFTPKYLTPQALRAQPTFFQTFVPSFLNYRLGSLQTVNQVVTLTQQWQFWNDTPALNDMAQSFQNATPRIVGQLTSQNDRFILLTTIDGDGVLVPESLATKYSGLIRDMLEDSDDDENPIFPILLKGITLDDLTAFMQWLAAFDVNTKAVPLITPGTIILMNFLNLQDKDDFIEAMADFLLDPTNIHLVNQVLNQYGEALDQVSTDCYCEAIKVDPAKAYAFKRFVDLGVESGEFWTNNTFQKAFEELSISLDDALTRYQQGQDIEQIFILATDDELERHVKAKPVWSSYYEVPPPPLDGLFLSNINLYLVVDFGQKTSIPDEFSTPEFSVRLFLDGKQIKNIGSKFLFSNSRLSRLDLSNLTALENIGDDFLYKSNISSIKLPASGKLRSIGSGFLSGCQTLMSLDLEPFKNVINIGPYFLFECFNLKTLNLEHLSKVRSMGDYFLYSCLSLRNVDLEPIKNARFDSFESRLHSLKYNTCQFRRCDHGSKMALIKPLIFFLGGQPNDIESITSEVVKACMIKHNVPEGPNDVENLLKAFLERPETEILMNLYCHSDGRMPDTNKYSFPNHRGSLSLKDLYTPPSATGNFWLF